MASVNQRHGASEIHLDEESGYELVWQRTLRHHPDQALIEHAIGQVREQVARNAHGATQHEVVRDKLPDVLVKVLPVRDGVVAIYACALTYCPTTVQPLHRTDETLHPAAAE